MFIVILYFIAFCWRCFCSYRVDSLPLAEVFSLRSKIQFIYRNRIKILSKFNLIENIRTKSIDFELNNQFMFWLYCKLFILYSFITSLFYRYPLILSSSFFLKICFLINCHAVDNHCV